MRSAKIIAFILVNLCVARAGTPLPAGKTGTCCINQVWVFDDEKNWTANGPETGPVEISAVTIPSLPIGPVSFSVKAKDNKGGSKRYTKYTRYECCDPEGRKKLEKLEGTITLNFGEIEASYRIPVLPKIKCKNLSTDIAPTPFSVSLTGKLGAVTFNGKNEKICDYPGEVITGNPVTSTGEAKLSGGVSTQLGKINLEPDSYILIVSEVTQAIDFIVNVVIDKGINKITALAVTISAEVGGQCPIFIDANAVPKLDDIGFNLSNFTCTHQSKIYCKYKVTFFNDYFDAEEHEVAIFSPSL